MQFSDTTNLTGLVEDIDFICGTDATSYPLKDKTRNMNRWYSKAVAWVLKAAGNWQYDDSNHTDLPILTETLVADQRDYTLPSDILKLQRVEVKDSAGNWSVVKPIDQSQMSVAIEEFQETSGIPEWYDLKGNSIYLYPAADTSQVTASEGLKIYISREFDAFVSTDTTQEPGLIELVHRILSLGASFDWLLVNSTREKSDSTRREITDLKGDLLEFYGDRDRDTKTGIRPAHRTQDYM